MNANLPVLQAMDDPVSLRAPALLKCLALVDEQPAAAADLLSDEMRQALPGLIQQARRDLEPADAVDLMNSLTRTLALGLGQGMSDAQETEFKIAAVEELEALPGEWALEGLRRARQECRWAKEIVPFVIAYAEDYPGRAKAKMERLERLQEAVTAAGQQLLEGPADA